MTRDEIRALIGGYATGSLTETERRTLFEAALEDQELFDELAGEQGLKELIDQPGMRQRLICSIEPVRARAWWQHPLPWLAIAASAAGIAILMLLPPRPAEVAKLEPPRIEAPQPQPQQTTIPRKQASQKSSQAKTMLENGPEVSSVTRDAPSAPPAPAPSTDRAFAPKQPPASGVVGGVAESEAKAREPAEVKKDTAKAGVGGAPISPAAELQAIPMAAPMGARAAAGKALGSLFAPFGFHYAIDWTGDAVITANADGYLSITANQTIVFPGAEVRPGSTTRVRVPHGSDSILIEFTASPPDASLQTAPVNSTTESTGTIADPAPSPHSKLRVRIAAKQPF